MNPANNIILYAEDDEDDRAFMREALDELEPDHILMMAVNGEILLKKLKELTAKHIQPCLVIIDGNMPIMTGKEAIAEIRSNTQWDKIPICIFSTSSENWFADMAMTYGVTIYRKPASLAEYKSTIRQILDHRAR